MAIDDISKRRAALGVGQPGSTVPLPDGEISSADMAALLGVYPMLGVASVASTDDILTRIKFRLSRRLTSAVDSQILVEMNAAKGDIAEQDPYLPNFLKLGVAFSVVGAHSGIVITSKLPNFLRPLSRDDDPALYYYDTASARYIPLKRYASWLELVQRYPGTGATPKGYFWDGNVEGTLALQPTPTGDLNYICRYYRKEPVDFAAGVTNLWTKYGADLIMNLTGRAVAVFYRDKDALQIFNEGYMVAYDRIKKQTTAQDESDAYDNVMGSED
jgi:hypothetical protein